MAVAELFIGAFITVLFEKLASGDLIKLARSAGIYSELSKWTDTLTQIQAVLVDAGQKHIKDKSVQLWLNKLQHLAYEIDDVLDDLATEAMRHRLDKTSDASTSKVLKFIPKKFHALKYGHNMSSKLNGITDKLCKLVDQKKLLGLNENVETSYRVSRRLEETSLVDESKIIGREGDKEALLDTLLGTDSSSSYTQNVSVMSIVGLGGIGKTTLARLLYNDKKAKGHFELMSWVCISDEFDVFTISKAIFKDVGGDDRKFETLNQLQQALAEKLSKKRFLLVLDDVWNENYTKWEQLQLPFNVGATGSKILVTTRKTKVESVMDSVQSYPLKLLSQEEALSLFAQNASGKQNFDVNQTLKQHGEDIVRRCGRLPLALRTLGRVFRTKSDHEEWMELLNSEIWTSHNGSEILPALRLSYYDLPAHLKQMFGYCCLFPKDYMFDKDDLVLLWMAEGFLSKSNGKKSMESFGRECFEELVSRSFFQHSNNNKSLYTMHDLMNDLAKSVAGEFFFMLDDKMDVDNKNEALEKSHHVSVIREKFEVDKKFKALQRARRMRTFLAMSVTRLNAWEVFYLSHNVLIVLLPQLQVLRWPLINSLSSVESLYIYQMPNMRLFPGGCLSYVTKLIIWGCDNIESIPDNGYGFLPFLCLRYLEISSCRNLNSFPYEQLQKLTSMEVMIISYCPSLDDSFPCGVWPPNLSYLRIGGLKKPISEWGLQNFPTSLVSLHLHGGEKSRSVVSFAAKGEGDMSASSSSSTSSFLLPSSLTQLDLSNFNELESVSGGLQHLTCLQHLDIWDCPKLRDLPETLLPSLSRLGVYGKCSPELKKKCRRNRKGKYWPIISQIPYLDLQFD